MSTAASPALRTERTEVPTSQIVTEDDVARALWRVYHRYPFRTDDDSSSPATLYAAVLAELCHPCEGLNSNAVALLAYVWQTRSSRLLWSYRVETASRPRWWHSYRWHVRHRPWLVECS